MSGTERGLIARPLLIGTVAILVDQGTKWIVAANLDRGRSIPVVGDFFRLTHVQNPGGAFGLFRDSGPLFLILSIAAVIFLFWTVRRFRSETAGMRWALGLVLGGAIGNLIDRVRSGRVVDFFDVGIGDLRWPVFNVADMAVVIGVGLFLLVSLRSGGGHDREERPEGRTEEDDRSSRGGDGTA